MRIRPARMHDVDDLHDLHVAVIAAGRGIVRDTPAPRERIAAWIASFVDGDCSGERGTMLVADLEGRAVGEVDVKRFSVPFCRHVGVVGLEVHPGFQRRGIGRALLEAAVGWGRRHGLRRVELQVRADNAGALALYRAAGFVQEGRRRRFVRLPDGRFVDDLLMGLLIG